MVENQELIAEETAIPDNGGTLHTDIAGFDPKIGVAKPTTSKCLPSMIGFIQKIDSPSAFTYALMSKDKTSISGDPDDIVLGRKSINTTMRQVIINTTNEVESDLNAMFGNDFEDYNQEAFNLDGGTLSNYFVKFGEWKLTAKINLDFMTWLDSEATNKGSMTVANWTELDKINAALGELKESLFKSTSKSGSTFAIVSPRIASYLASTVANVSNGHNVLYNKGRQVPNNAENGYVCTLGDTDIYQYDFENNVTGGTGPSTEGTGTMFVGFTGGPSVASIYYTPYRKYIVKGGSDPYTGHSNVFFRVRDMWSTNPQDTYSKASTTPYVDDSSEVETQKSQYVMKATVVFSDTVLA